MSETPVIKSIKPFIMFDLPETPIEPKLQDAQANYPQWVAAIAGKLGNPTDQGFVLDEPNIQVFEKKPKDVTAV